MKFLWCRAKKTFGLSVLFSALMVNAVQKEASSCLLFWLSRLSEVIMCSCPDYKVQGVCRGACSAKQGLFPKTGCKLRKERKAPNQSRSLIWMFWFVLGQSPWAKSQHWLLRNSFCLSILLHLCKDPILKNIALIPEEDCFDLIDFGVKSKDSWIMLMS